MEKKFEITLPFAIPNTSYTLRELTPEYTPAAISILATTFVEGEPQSIWLKLTHEELSKFFKEKLEASLKTGPNLSVVVTDSTNEVVAADFCCEFDLQKEELKGNPFEHQTILLDNSYRDYYAKAKQEGKVMESFGGGVADKAKGKELIWYLVLGNLYLAYKNGFTWFISQTSNIYTSSQAERNGMKKIDEAVYDEYLYEGKKVFAGLDEFFTAFLNKKRPADKQLKSAAKFCGQYEIKIKDALSHFI